MITVSILPTLEFNERSGMATSTRRVAQKLWRNKLPVDSYQTLAWMLFCCDNPPGTKTVSGSQDAIGLVFPGLARAHYEGEYWPTSIEHHLDGKALDFVEQALYLRPLGPRISTYDVLANTRIDREGARALAAATQQCWEAILAQDLAAFGAAVRASFEAQIAMFPNMVNEAILDLIQQYADVACGWKLSGAGGGGYLVLVSDRPIEHAVRIVVRREAE